MDLSGYFAFSQSESFLVMKYQTSLLSNFEAVKKAAFPEKRRKAGKFCRKKFWKKITIKILMSPFPAVGTGANPGGNGANPGGAIAFSARIW